MFLLKMQKKRSILGGEGSASLNPMTPPLVYWLQFLIFIGYSF